MIKSKRVCRKCKSEDVRYEGSVVWDVDSQEWVLDDWYEHTGYCFCCEDMTNIIDEDIPA